MMGLLLPQADGAADMGADLGIAENAADVPIFARLGDLDGVRIHPDDDDGRLAFSAGNGTVEILEIRRFTVDKWPIDVSGLIGSKVTSSPTDAFARSWYDGCGTLPRGQVQGRQSESIGRKIVAGHDQAAADDLAPGELGLIDHLSSRSACRCGHPR